MQKKLFKIINNFIVTEFVSTLGKQELCYKEGAEIIFSNRYFNNRLYQNYHTIHNPTGHNSSPPVGGQVQRKNSRE